MMKIENVAAIVHEAGREFWLQAQGSLAMRPAAWEDLAPHDHAAVIEFATFHLRSTYAVPGLWHPEGDERDEEFHRWFPPYQAAEMLACGIVDALRDFVDEDEIAKARA